MGYKTDTEDSNGQRNEKGIEKMTSNNLKRFYYNSLYVLIGSMTGFGFFWVIHLSNVMPVLWSIWYAHFLSTAFGMMIALMDRKNEA
ncbi:MAG: hypothetical protein PHQ60_16340 [Sideroxydans sp.]|nr:hypothetical protein [Sideroxydans sp.]